MSIAIMSLVFKCNMPELKADNGNTVSDSSAKFVLLALADHANDEGEGAYPSIKTLCKKTNLSTATVVNALNGLRNNGFIQLVGKSKRDTHNYTILVTRIGEFQWLESSDSNEQSPKILTTEKNPSPNHPLKPSSNKSATPRANEFPSNVLFREVTERYPAKANWHTVLKHISDVEKRLGRTPTREDLFPFYESWCGMGWNPQSVNWLEYAVKGVLPAKNKTAPAEPKGFGAIRQWLGQEAGVNG